jgi:type II secretory pathway component PulF
MSQASVQPAEKALPAAEVSLDDLIALGDEMAALARSGVPLERGLLNLGQEIPGRLGRLARELGERASRGESLTQVMAAQPEVFPQIYRVVVEAGLRAGRLSVALEGLTASARRLAEMRRIIGLAIVYPLAVLLLAHGLFVFFVLHVAPELQTAYAELRARPNRLLDWFVAIGDSAHIWGPAVPVIVLLFAGLWWRHSGRALLVHPGRAGRLLGWVPWMGRLIRYSQASMFAEVFALLIEHHVALDDALRLAARASGDPATCRTAEAAGAALRRGEPMSDQLLGCPPLLGWLLATRPERRVLLAAARHAADHYRWRAAYQAEAVRTVVPVLLTAVIGGTVALLYCLTLLAPWTSLLEGLSR